MCFIKRVLLRNVAEDMILARDVVDEHGRVLITAGTALTPNLLDLLRNHHILSLWIQETSPANQDISVVQNLISGATKLKMVHHVQNAFYSTEGIASHIIHLQRDVEEIVEELSKREYLLIHLSDIRVKSDYLFLHSVHVGLIAIVLGIAMGMSKEETCILGMGGLLHDFGKTRIAGEILNKPGGLTFEEFKHVKEHVTYGYNILKNEAGALDHRIMLTALQHHERCDGKGYPWGISGPEIHEFAKIVAVADVYDALTTDRTYRPRIAPQEAVRMINTGMETQFDLNVIAAFNQVAVPYPIGSSVRLNNGVQGTVLRLNTANPACPVVWTATGLIDLLEERDITIQVAI